MEKFDVTVIGGGPGGYPAAIRAAQLGASVVLVEKESLGGTCLNWGCIPTKTLIASSSLFAQIKHSDKLGLKTENVSFDFSGICERRDKVITTLRNGVTQLLKANGIKVFSGSTASFAGRNRIVIKAKGGSEDAAIETGQTIIATGSESAMPGFIPKGERIVESRAFLGMKSLPKSMIVLGGGVIGCEFASFAAQLGTKVVIVELLDDIMMMLDADVRRVVRDRMEKTLGIEILTGQPMKDIKADGNGVGGKAGDRTVEGELLLVSVGRRPVTEGLCLDKAGLSTNETGFIEIDEYCRTKAATIYAVGDVTAGSTQLAHAATSQGMTAAENAYGGKHRPAETLVPACIFTEPEAASVGLTEQKAAGQGIAIAIGKFRFSGLGKAIAAGETDGFVKWIADANTGQLLGAQAVGPHATELISEATVAIRAELTAAELGRTIHCHPTFSEAWMEAAHAVHGECIHAAPKRKS